MRSKLHDEAPCLGGQRFSSTPIRAGPPKALRLQKILLAPAMFHIRSNQGIDGQHMQPMISSGRLSNAVISFVVLVAKLHSPATVPSRNRLPLEDLRCYTYLLELICKTL